MNTTEERIGDYRLRRTGEELIADERASHPVWEIPRLLFGFGFMAPAVVVLGILLRPSGVLGVSLRTDPNPLPAVAWGGVVFWLVLTVVFFLIGCSYSFCRRRLVAKPGQLALGETWFGKWARLRILPVSKASTLEIHNSRSGVFGGFPVRAVRLSGAAEPIQLFTCHEASDAQRLAEAVGGALQLPVKDQTGN